MSDFDFTDFLEDIDSSAIDAAYYNLNDKKLAVVTNADEVYVYSGVPSYIWNTFKDSNSKGSFWATTIKRDYGPSNHLGNWWNLNMAEVEDSVPAPSMASVTPIGAGRRQTFPLAAQPGTVGTPKGLTLAPTAQVNDESTSSSAEAFPTNKHGQVLSKHTVVFDIVGGKNGNTTDVEVTGVEAAREEIERVAGIMGLEVKVRAVTVYFE